MWPWCDHTYMTTLTRRRGKLKMHIWPTIYDWNTTTFRCHMTNNLVVYIWQIPHVTTIRPIYAGQPYGQFIIWPECDQLIFGASIWLTMWPTEWIWPNQVNADIFHFWYCSTVIFIILNNNHTVITRTLSQELQNTVETRGVAELEIPWLYINSLRTNEHIWYEIPIYRYNNVFGQMC